MNKKIKKILQNIISYIFNIHLIVFKNDQRVSSTNITSY